MQMCDMRGFASEFLQTIANENAAPAHTARMARLQPADALEESVVSGIFAST